MTEVSVIQVSVFSPNHCWHLTPETLGFGAWNLRFYRFGP